MLYRTEDLARWGVGKGSNLEPGEIDGNLWELAQRLVAVEANAGEAANGIANIGVVGSQMTVYLGDGTALGPYTLPTAMIRYRGDWTSATSYNELDLVTVPAVGVYLVLQDHTSGATFDALAAGADSNPLYRWLFPMGGGGGGGGANVSDEGALVLGTPSDINFAGAGVTVADDGDGSVTVTIPGSTGGASTLDGLSDVTISGPAAGQFLRYDGSQFVNAVVAWGDLSGVPASFPPSAHQHPWGDLTGVPATFPPSPHTHPATDVAGTAVETIAGTAYTQVAADRARWKRTTDAAAVTITIDANVNAAGDEITFSQGGAGQITFAAGAGMTLNARGAALKSAGQFAVCGVKFISATEATLFGDLTT